MKVLAQEDLENDLEYDREYYLELTELLYDRYDLNQDEALSLDEWQNFANDILDESTEHYKEVQQNPKLIEGIGIEL